MKISNLFELKKALEKVGDELLKEFTVGVDTEGSQHLTCGIQRGEDEILENPKLQDRDAKVIKKSPALKSIIKFFQKCGEAEVDEDNDGYPIEV